MFDSDTLAKTQRLSEQLSELNKTLAKSIQDSLAPILNLHERSTSMLGRLKQNPGYVCWQVGLIGYYLPPKLCDPGLLEESDLEIKVLSLYKADNHRLLEKMLNDIKEHYHPAQQKYLDDAFEAFRRSLYSPAASCVMPLVEPLLIKKGFMQKGGILATQTLKKMLDESLKLPASSAVLSASAAVLSLDNLFSRTDFNENGDEIDVFNRHVLLHGRSVKAIDESDFVKLVSAIYGVSLIEWDSLGV